MVRNSILKIFIVGIALFLSSATLQTCLGETGKQSGITKEQISEHVKILSADDMGGRRIYSEGIEKAQDYIVSRFEKAGLKSFESISGYRQEFNRTEFGPVEENSYLTLNSTKLKAKFWAEEDVSLKELNVAIQPEDIVFYEVSDMSELRSTYGTIGRGVEGKNHWVWIEPGDEANRLLSYLGSGLKRVLKVDDDDFDMFVVIAIKPESGIKGVADIEIDVETMEHTLTNVIGYIEGTDPVLKDEFIMYSGHHDHIGFAESGEDLIFNGADDDASGVAGVIALAEYFAKVGSNNRSILFTSFTAEEVGGWGSKYMAENLPVPAEKIIAMFNLEMIGKESKWGVGKAFLTGFERSELGGILQNALGENSFELYEDPYPDQNLFNRSDNSSFAKMGVPAHSVSTDQIDSDPFYHKVTDEFKTLDMNHMMIVIQGIADGSRTLISGEKTPARIK